MTSWPRHLIDFKLSNDKHIIQGRLLWGSGGSGCVQCPPPPHQIHFGSIEGPAGQRGHAKSVLAPLTFRKLLMPLTGPCNYLMWMLFKKSKLFICDFDPLSHSHRKNVCKNTCSSNITLSLPSHTGSALKRKLNFCNGYLSLLYFWVYA